MFPARYRRVVFDETVTGVLRDVCLDLERRHQLKFMGIDEDKDHVHFHEDTVRNYSKIMEVYISNRTETNSLFSSDTPLLAAGLFIWVNEHFELDFNAA